MASPSKQDSGKTPEKKQPQEAFVPHPELGESDDVNKLSRKPGPTKKGDDSREQQQKPPR